MTEIRLYKVREAPRPVMNRVVVRSMTKLLPPRDYKRDPEIRESVWQPFRR